MKIRRLCGQIRRGYSVFDSMDTIVLDDNGEPQDVFYRFAELRYMHPGVSYNFIVTVGTMEPLRLVGQIFLFCAIILWSIMVVCLFLRKR